MRLLVRSTVKVERGGLPLEGVCTYSRRDRSFGFVPTRPSALERLIGLDGTASYSLGLLEIEFCVSTGQLLYAWGYLPESAWREERLESPTYVEGTVRCSNQAAQRGVSYPLQTSRAWLAQFDSGNGWIRVSCSSGGGETGVLIATSTIVVPCGESISELWLRPTYID